MASRPRQQSPPHSGHSPSPLRAKGYRLAVMIQRYPGRAPASKAGQNQRAFGRHNASHRVINIDIIRHGVNVQRHTVLAICRRIRHHHASRTRPYEYPAGRQRRRWLRPARQSKYWCLTAGQLTPRARALPGHRSGHNSPAGNRRYR